MQVRSTKSCKIDKKGLYITYSKAILQIMPVYPALNQYLAKFNKKSCTLCICAYVLSPSPWGVYMNMKAYIYLYLYVGGRGPDHRGAI